MPHIFNTDGMKEIGSVTGPGNLYGSGHYMGVNTEGRTFFRFIFFRNGRPVQDVTSGNPEGCYSAEAHFLRWARIKSRSLLTSR